MSNNYLGEIRTIAFNFAPQGWALCDGSLLPIAEYDALFTLLGTTYGGDGQSTFGLPDLRSRVAVHEGTGTGGTFQLGQNGGQESVALNSSQLPAHSHSIAAQTAGGTQASPSGGYFAASPEAQFGNAGGLTMAPNVLTSTGGSQPHSNIQPYVAMNYVIALQGIFPSSN